jgi:acetyl esterase/lipase
MGERRETLSETGWFSPVYKFFALVFEWLFTPIINLDPPPVKMYLRDIPYVPEPSNRKQRLDVVVPEGDGPFPVLVYVHGGGFISMDKKQYRRVAKSFAAAGHVVFNVNYRRAPAFRYPVNLTDVGTAVAWALRNAAAYGGDPGTVFLAGDSAGAHLVSTYSTSLQDEALVKAFRLEGVEGPRKVAGLVLLYGVFDCETVLDTGFPFVKMMLQSFLSRDPVIFKERARSASPIRHITPDYPPCFITYAEKDGLSSESAAFAKELERQGVEHRVLAIPRRECRIIAHGFVSTFWRRCARKAMAAATDFLHEHA